MEIYSLEYKMFYCIFDVIKIESMKNILVFAGSNSKTSINKQLAVYASTLLEDVSVTVLDLNDFPLPVFSVDIEREEGIPSQAQSFFNHIKNTDGIIMSLAEHNGAYATVFKNLFDWMSRIDGKVWQNKPMLLMATSPGARGGQSVLDIAKGRFPFNGGHIVATFSLPKFNDHFKSGAISDDALNTLLKEAVDTLKKEL